MKWFVVLGVFLFVATAFLPELSLPSQRLVVDGVVVPWTIVGSTLCVVPAFIARLRRDRI